MGLQRNRRLDMTFLLRSQNSNINITIMKLSTAIARFIIARFLVMFLKVDVRCDKVGQEAN
jgi:hypothetical protein